MPSTEHSTAANPGPLAEAYSGPATSSRTRPADGAAAVPGGAGGACAEEGACGPPGGGGGSHADPAESTAAGPGAGDPAAEDTLDLPVDLLPELPEQAGDPAAGHCPAIVGDLLDDLPGWGPVSTPLGVFQLVPVRLSRDLSLISRWMNDPSVAEFWQLAGPEEVTARHLRGQLEGDGRSVPCLGVLDGAPMSYWEVYRADLDPVARYYPARPQDTGLHLLIGRAVDRGRGLGAGLLRAAADHVLDHRPGCARVIAEPDLRNTPSVSAFLTAGFRFAAEVELPGKRAALMIRDRALRHLL